MTRSRSLHDGAARSGPARGGPARQGEAGFALVESLAVLVLSALVLMTLLIATDLVSRNSAAAARRADDLETLATGLAAVRRDLEGARYTVSSGETEAPLIFAGTADSVGVVVGSARSDGGTGESLVWIEARYADGEGELVRSSAPLLPATSGFADVELANPVVLASGPWQYRLAYADVGGERPVWKEGWSKAAGLPLAIRLEVLDGDERRVAPALTVRINANTSGCAAQEGGCRGDGAAAGDTEPETDRDGRPVDK